LIKIIEFTWIRIITKTFIFYVLEKDPNTLHIFKIEDQTETAH